jgi:hypothetical protein
VFDEHGEKPFPIRNVLAADSPLATAPGLLVNTYLDDTKARFGAPLRTLLTDSGPIRECCHRFKQIHWLASLRARMLTKN